VLGIGIVNIDDPFAVLVFVLVVEPQVFDNTAYAYVGLSCESRITRFYRKVAKCLNF